MDRWEPHGSETPENVKQFVAEESPGCEVP